MCPFCPQFTDWVHTTVGTQDRFESIEWPFKLLTLPDAGWREDSARLLAAFEAGLGFGRRSPEAFIAAAHLLSFAAWAWGPMLRADIDLQPGGKVEARLGRAAGEAVDALRRRPSAGHPNSTLARYEAALGIVAVVASLHPRLAAACWAAGATPAVAAAMQAHHGCSAALDRKGLKAALALYKGRDPSASAAEVERQRVEGRDCLCAARGIPLLLPSGTSLGGTPPEQLDGNGASAVTPSASEIPGASGSRKEAERQAQAPPATTPAASASAPVPAEGSSAPAPVATAAAGPAATLPDRAAEAGGAAAAAAKKKKKRKGRANQGGVSAAPEATVRGLAPAPEESGVEAEAAVVAPPARPPNPQDAAPLPLIPQATARRCEPSAWHEGRRKPLTLSGARSLRKAMAQRLPFRVYAGPRCL